MNLFAALQHEFSRRHIGPNEYPAGLKRAGLFKNAEAGVDQE